MTLHWKRRCDSSVEIWTNWSRWDLSFAFWHSFSLISASYLFQYFWNNFLDTFALGFFICRCFFLECPKMTFQRSLKSYFSRYLLQFKEFLDHIFRVDLFFHDNYEDIGFGVVWHEIFQKIKIFYFLSYLPFKTILSSNSFGNLLLRT